MVLNEKGKGKHNQFNQWEAQTTKVSI